MELNKEQIQEFINEGYIVVSGLIPQVIVNSSLKTMWRALKVIEDDPTTWPEENVLTYHEVNHLMAPCRTANLEEIAEQLVGRYFVRAGGFSPVLNFPKPGEKKFEPMYFHIDGLDELALWPVTRYIVILIYLIETSTYGGATAVSPGSHRQIFYYYLEHENEFDKSGLVPNLPYRDPIPLSCKAGDVIFMHYLLAHASSMNHDVKIRVALNGTIRPDPKYPYKPKKGRPHKHWTPLDWTLRTDTL